MNINLLIKNYVNNRKEHKRKIGRYWASDLYSILTGRLRPTNFLKEKKMDIQSCRNILRGQEKENTLKNILDFNKIDYKYQEKKVENINGFELVVVTDFFFKDRILETKAPSIMPESIRKYEYPQLEAQYRVFKKPVYVMYLGSGANKSYVYIPSDKLWKTIIEALTDFHKKVCQLE